MKFKKTVVYHIGNIIVNSIKPLLIIEYFYGVFRYRINGRPLVPIDLWMKILGVIITSLWISSIYAFCFVPTIKNILTENLQTVNIMHVLPWILISIHYLVTNMMVIFLHGKNNVRVIEKLAEIDFSLQTTMNEGFYKASQYKSVKLIVFYILFCVLMSTMSFFFEFSMGAADLLYMLLYFERKIEILVFCQFLYLLRQRLQLIKLYIVKFITERNQRKNITCKIFMKKTKVGGSIDFIQRSSHNNNKILALASVYDNVGELCKFINGIYNCLMFMTIISAFVFILVVFWTSLNFMKVKREDQNILMLSKATAWSVAELFSIVFMSYHCEKLLMVREEIRTVLSKLIVHDDIPKNMRYQAKVFMELTELWPLSFYVSNMFQVNKKLVLKFISICTSYLIVVIQINDLV